MITDHKRINIKNETKVKKCKCLQNTDIRNWKLEIRKNEKSLRIRGLQTIGRIA